jgi:hypothetical protein
MLGKALAFRLWEVTQSERQILLHRQPWKDGAALKDKNILAAWSSYQPAIHRHFPTIRPIEPGENGEEDRLAIP